VLGSKAAYVAASLDGQEDALRAGRRPDQRGFGDEPPERWGHLVRGAQEQPVPSLPGRWAVFYEEVVGALLEGTAPPVDPEDAVAVLEVLDAVRRSATDGTVMAL
jgi:predicted dehydrogenase